MKSSSWLLFLYGLPTRQNSARVSLWRKLKQFGAVALKSSAYILPDEPAHYERFQWLVREIVDGGGEATLIRIAEIDGLSYDQAVQLFNEARAADYRGLVDEVQAAMRQEEKKTGGTLASQLEKFRRRYNEIKAIDYFGSAAAENAQVILDRAAKRLSLHHPVRITARLRKEDFQNKTWLTRPRPGIDRAASAWLIRKFIDSRAKFVFGTDPAKFPHALPFDMADVELSHHDDDCTFETLVKRFAIVNKTVAQIAEMVHDADLEDGKFQRYECIGINAVLDGWAKSDVSDAELLAKGVDCFDGLYRKLSA